MTMNKIMIAERPPLGEELKLNWEICTTLVEQTGNFLDVWIGLGYTIITKPSPTTEYEGILVAYSAKNKPKNWPVGYYKKI